MRFLTFLLFLLPLLSYGQTTLQGKVLDTQNEALIGSTVVLLSPEDSSMVAFGISDTEGIFYLEDVDPGDYILQCTYVSYANVLKPVSVAGGLKKMDLGEVIMEPTSETIQEVMVTAEHIPMGIMGDTISYNAAAFKTKPGASVEDLLKKLPGIDVERDGSIKAMGEDVQNVLIDGKEFFGDDPKIATKNLEAEAVDKVELYDKKSEIAEFTGIDDGAEEKTINLKLKEEYKQGGFGNAELSGGTSSRYDGKLNYNRFSPRMQAAAIVSANNINQQAFSFNEYIQFMGGIGNAISSNNGMFNFGEFGQNRAPKGLTDNLSSGLNFNYDLSKKLELTSHYFFLNSDRVLESTTTSNEFTDMLDYSTLDQLIVNTRNQNHRLSAKLKYKPNPYLQLLWKNSLYGIFSDESNNGNTAFTQNSLMASTTTTNFFNNTDQYGYEGSLQLRGKFKKKGRNWINTLRYQAGQLEEASDLVSTYLFQSGVNDRVDQLQNYTYQKQNLKAESAYTEPLGNKFYLGLQYLYDLDTESPEKLFYDREGSLAVLNDELSTGFVKTNTIHRGGLSLKRNAKKLKLNAGVGFQMSEIVGELDGEPHNLVNDFKHILPSGSLDWDITREKSFNLSYNTNINLPTLNQLAPLPDNSNPNFLAIGNPELNPEYAHNFRVSFSSFDQFYHKNFYMSLSGALIEDRVINEISIDENFITTLRPINTDHYTRLRGYASYSSPIRPLKIKYHINGSMMHSDYVSYLNGLESGVKETNFNIDFFVENRIKEHVDIASGVRMDYNIRNYDVNADFNQSFFNTSMYIDGIVYLGKDWTISTTFDYVSFSGEFFSERETYNLWSASVEKGFMNNKLTLSLKAYDLLNQNIGLDRLGRSNSLREERYNTLTQYFMVGVSYKIGKKKQKDMVEFN